jgi:hypothetical protein
LNGLNSILVTPGTPVRLETTIDDTTTGNSNILGAEWNADVCPFVTGTGNATVAQDGNFDSPLEPVEYDPIDTTGWTERTYLIYVQASDVVPNTNTACPFATLIVGTIDNQPPEIFAAQVDNMTAVRVAPGAQVYFDAIVDDTLRGGSNVGGATQWMYWTVQTKPSTTSLTLLDGPTTSTVYV